MFLALTIYAYCQEVRSSRQIERMCVSVVAFRVLCARDGPDHATIARFWAQARDAFIDLSSQVLSDWLGDRTDNGSNRLAHAPSG